MFHNSKSHGQSAFGSRRLLFEYLESKEMLSIAPIGDLSIDSSINTGEKPQSKIWTYANQWWSVVPDNDGTWISRLDGDEWTQTTQLTSNSSYKADVKSIDDLAHILLLDGSDSQLASVEYDANLNSYVMWDQRPTLVDMGLPGGIETATIDIDSLGRMWIAFDQSDSVEVRYSDGLYSNWSSSIVLASNIDGDDISVITAMPNNTVGVLWSNQSTERFGFRYHVDGTNPNQWSADEIPASQSAQNRGGGMADDHLNVAVASDGTLYAAVKTSYDGGGQTKIALLVRRPNGQWDNMYDVAGSGTRPIVILNEDAGRLIVAYTESDSGGDILYKETATNNISFGSSETLISGSLNNVTSTKQNFTDEVVVLASRGSRAEGVLFSFGSIDINEPPQVNAGSDQSVLLGESITLSGIVSDDGLPSPGNLSTSWTVVSGPGSVNFGNSGSASTSAQFSTVGNYVLQLTANDGLLTGSDQVTVNVTDGSGPVTMAFQDGIYPFVNYNGTRDTYIMSDESNSNFGSSSSLEVDGKPDQAALLGWDVSAIPVGSTVTSARLELNVTNSTSNDYEVYALERAWDELSATWEQAAGGAAWASQGADSAADRGTTVLGQLSASSSGNYELLLNGAGIAVVQSWVNDPSSNHGLIFQDYVDASNGIDFSSRETGNASDRPMLEVTYLSPGGNTINEAPQVNAGSNQSITLGQSVVLVGSANDDGLPSPGNLTTSWTVVSGPGSVSFGNNSSTTTTAQFSTAGSYVLQLTANDGQLTGSDQVTVTVNPGAPTNQAPQVNAGNNQTITLGQSVVLSGSVSDDGLPSPGNLSTSWTVVSGPGSVSFGNNSSTTTTAQFSAAGSYVLQLTANDGQLTGSDQVNITVNNLPTNQAPQVNAGNNQSVLLGESITLSGIVSDDGLPSPGNLSTSWTVVSGPGSVNFGNSGSASTSAQFSTVGNYVLQLTANDGLLTGSDQVTVNVTDGSGPVTMAFQDGIYPFVNYNGTRDTYIMSDESNSNFGSSSSLEVDGKPDQAALLGWDVSAIPVGSTVTSARLELNVTNSTSNDYEVYALERAWDELSATWEQAAGGAAWASQGADSAADRGTTVLGQLSASSSGNYELLLNGAGIAVVQSWVNDPSSNHGLIFQDYVDASNGIDFSSRETGNASDRPMLEVTYLSPGGNTINEAPQVNAGSNQSITLGQSVVLVGSANDDGLPSPGNLTTSWTVVSGPGSVSFGNNSSTTTTAQFSTAGSYVLQLTANDGQLTGSDQVTVTVNPGAPTNQAPQVNAGNNQTITLGQSVVLSGSVSDDGLPSPGNLSTSWTVVSGPGSVSFGNNSSTTTTAQFSAAGSYVLQLTANDGQLTGSDQVNITVNNLPTNSSGLVGHWSLDSTSGNTLTDSSGQGNHGNVNGSPQVVAGPTGSAMQFDGTSDYVEITDTPSLDMNQQITISTWIRPDAKGTQYLVKKADHGETDGFELSLSSSGKVFVRFNQASDKNDYRLNSTVTYPTDGNEWMHVVATYDGSSIKLYINGQLDNSRDEQFTIATNNLPLALGAQHGGYRAYSGGMDDVQIYDRAVDAAEVQSLYTNV